MGPCGHMGGWEEAILPLTWLLIHEDLSKFWVSSFPWQHHTAGEAVSAPIRLVTAAEDRVRASQIIKSLLLAQCYWLMVHCVSWAADSEAFIFHRSCAAIRWRFQLLQLCVGRISASNRLIVSSLTSKMLTKGKRFLAEGGHLKIASVWTRMGISLIFVAERYPPGWLSVMGWGVGGGFIWFQWIIITATLISRRGGDISTMLQ